MSKDKFYDVRDAMALDTAGGYYFRHVSAMTAEELDRKSDIAAELGWRDMQIADLQRKVEALAVERDLVAADNSYLRGQIISWAKECDRIIYTHTNKVTDAHQLEAEKELSSTLRMADAVLAGIEARGVDKFAKYCGEDNSVFVEAKSYYRGLSEAACEFSDHLRKESGQ